MPRAVRSRRHARCSARAVTISPGIAGRRPSRSGTAQRSRSGQRPSRSTRICAVRPIWRSRKRTTCSARRAGAACSWRADLGSVRRRAAPRRERKDVQMGQSRVVDQRERPLEHRLGLGRSPRSGPRRRRCHAAPATRKVDHVGAPVAALHALQDQVVARLDAEVQMRHQALLVRDQIDQIGVDLGRIDRRETQAAARASAQPPDELADQAGRADPCRRRSGRRRSAPLRDSPRRPGGGPLTTSPAGTLRLGPRP